MSIAQNISLRARAVDGSGDAPRRGAVAGPGDTCH